jgi:SpoVK/Ycf46/Vps4 family AAA+-type ATPase
VFEVIERQRAVFLFDEFDSLGLARGSQHDVAEMRRVLNSFLVFIDSMRGNSIVIAASNHPDALDVALFRRFDDIIEYGLPSRKEVELLMKRHLLQEKDSDINWSKVLGAMQGMTFAEAERVASEAIKERIIEGLPCVSTPLLLSALADRRRLSRPTKA